MKKLICLLYLALVSSCASQMSNISSGLIGCSPKEIDIEDSTPTFFAGETKTWIATCRGKIFYCSKLTTEKGASETNCKESLK